MGLDGRVGGVSVGCRWDGTGVVLFFPPPPSHVKEVWFTFKTRVLLLFDCVGFGSSRGKDTDRGLNRRGDLITWQTDIKKGRRERTSK